MAASQCGLSSFLGAPTWPRGPALVTARAVAPHTPPAPGLTFARPTHFFGFIAAIICFAASRSIRTNDANCWPESSASAPSIVTSSPVW